MIYNDWYAIKPNQTKPNLKEETVFFLILPVVSEETRETSHEGGRKAIESFKDEKSRLLLKWRIYP